LDKKYCQDVSNLEISLEQYERKNNIESSDIELFFFKNEENLEKIDDLTTKELTRDTAQKLLSLPMEIIMTDDFFIDDDEYDIPDIEGNTNIFDDDDDPYFTKTQYLGQELLNIGGFDVKLADIFVHRPKIKNKNNQMIQ